MQRNGEIHIQFGRTISRLHRRRKLRRGGLGLAQIEQRLPTKFGCQCGVARLVGVVGQIARVVDSLLLCPPVVGEISASISRYAGANAGRTFTALASASLSIPSRCSMSARARQQHEAGSFRSGRDRERLDLSCAICRVGTHGIANPRGEPARFRDRACGQMLRSRDALHPSCRRGSGADRSACGAGADHRAIAWPLRQAPCRRPRFDRGSPRHPPAHRSGPDPRDLTRVASAIIERHPRRRHPTAKQPTSNRHEIGRRDRRRLCPLFRFTGRRFIADDAGLKIKIVRDMHPTARSSERAGAKERFFSYKAATCMAKTSGRESRAAIWGFIARRTPPREVAPSAAHTSPAPPGRNPAAGARSEQKIGFAIGWIVLAVGSREKSQPQVFDAFGDRSVFQGPAAKVDLQIEMIGLDGRCLLPFAGSPPSLAEAYRSPSDLWSSKLSESSEIACSSRRLASPRLPSSIARRALAKSRSAASGGSTGRVSGRSLGEIRSWFNLVERQLRLGIGHDEPWRRAGLRRRWMCRRRNALRCRLRGASTEGKQHE